MPNRYLFLVRHGESAFNAEHRVQGQADAPLSDRGRGQARALGPVLPEFPVDTVIASDLERARETGELAGLHPQRIEERWRERGMGEWENTLEAELGRDALRAFREGSLTPRGGESVPEFLARVGAAIDAVAADESLGSVLVFTHGGCIRAAAAHLTGAAYTQISGPVNTSISVFQLAPRRRLLSYNWTVTAGLPRATDPGAAQAPDVRA